MNPIFNIQFWQTRLENARKLNRLSDSVGCGFNFSIIDEIHKKIISENIKIIDSILDIGCGYGRAKDFFADRSYIGIDFVPEFIDIAKKKYPDCNFLLADIHILPFDDLQFDFGVCISMKGMIVRESGQKEWDIIQQELKRVCNKLLILEWGNNNIEDIKKFEII